VSGKSGSFADAPDTKDIAAKDGCKPQGWGFSFFPARSAGGITLSYFLPGSRTRRLAGFLLPDPALDFDI